MRDSESVNRNTLLVRTMGGFSMSWNGSPVGGRTKDSQFIRLMEVVLHNLRDGVTRSELEEILFEDSRIDDPSHMFRTIFYNMRQRLEKDGLPNNTYINNIDGTYYWTPDIAVKEDAAGFERLYSEASEERDPEKKLALFLDAVHAYTGEFLPAQARLVWVAEEDRRYRGVFARCVESAAEILRAKHDAAGLESLGRYAAGVQPLSGWEPLTMEGLIGQEKLNEARQFYELTESRYINELGFSPSFGTIDILEKLGSRLEHSHAILDEIQLQLTGRNEPSSGGYVCTFPVFLGIYRMMERLMETSGMTAHVMLCTIVDGKGRPMKDGAVLERLSPKLAEIIEHSVRHCDVVCRYGKGQYLLLLINVPREDCAAVQKRISDGFLENSQRTGVRYSVRSLYVNPEEIGR